MHSSLPHLITETIFIRLNARGACGQKMNTEEMVAAFCHRTTQQVIGAVANYFLVLEMNKPPIKSIISPRLSITDTWRMSLGVWWSNTDRAPNTISWVLSRNITWQLIHRDTKIAKRSVNLSWIPCLQGLEKYEEYDSRLRIRCLISSSDWDWRDRFNSGSGQLVELTRDTHARRLSE